MIPYLGYELISFRARMITIVRLVFLHASHPSDLSIAYLPVSQSVSVGHIVLDFMRRSEGASARAAVHRILRLPERLTGLVRLP